MFGRNKEKQKEQKGKEKPYAVLCDYMGGHAMYPKKRSVTAVIYDEFVHIEKLDLKIPINSIEKIETEDARRITATRIALVGVFALLLKKKFIYTVIDYHDGIQEQHMVLDLDRFAEKFQQKLYERMLASHTKERETEQQLAQPQPEVRS